MKTTLFTAIFFAVIGLFSTSNAMATTAWIDWTSTSAGTIDVGGSTANVSLTGTPYNYVDGDYYYNNAQTGGTSASGTYGGLAPTDFIQIVYGGEFTVNFSEAVINPYISLISVGQPSYEVTYSFNNAFSVISYGPNYWGYNGYSVSGNDFTGTEFNGILQFTGSFNSISFVISPNENWHGFNFGVASASVPEPSTLFLLSAGLLTLVAGRKKLQS